VVSSEAAEHRKIVTANSPHRTKNALIQELMAVQSTAQSPDWTVFLITLDGFGMNTASFADFGRQTSPDGCSTVLFQGP
jgi:hypothetical protein